MPMHHQPLRNLAQRTAVPALAVLISLLFGRSPESASIVVRPGEDLQQALNSARPGDTIMLEPGATYVGNFVLPAKSGDDARYIIVRSSAPDWTLPGEGERITPAHQERLPKLRSPNTSPALATAPGAHHYRLMFLEFRANAQGFGDIITLGDGSAAQNSLTLVPHDIVVDRCFIHGDPVAGQKRGIALNSASTSIVNSHISDMKAVGQDAQAIAGWNGPGPFQITNNYLEGSGENIMFGGADPFIRDLVPSDITVSLNHIAKPLNWRTEKWSVKNLFELKNARRVTISRNLMENNWLAAQTGYAILFTVRGERGRCPWCRIEDVVFERNLVRHVAAGVSILGHDDAGASGQLRGLTVQNNVFADLDMTKWGGNGYFLLVGGEPRDIVIDHNTIIQENASGIVSAGGPPVLGFVFTNNLTRHHTYGIKGDGRASGQDTIRAFFPGAQVSSNVMADGEAFRYPAGNWFPSSGEFKRQFMAYDEGDYRLIPNSVWRGAGSDRRDLGASDEMSSSPRPGPQPPRIPDPR
jgi:hypothetical protein